MTMSTRLEVMAWALVTLCVAVNAAGAQAAMSSSSAGAPEITASGRGEVHLAPSYAVVMVNVTSRANAAGEAASQNAQTVEATMKALRGAGLTNKDIATAGYSLQQNFEYLPNRQPLPTGFSAHTTIRVEVRRLESLGRVIDAAISGGATGISTVQFLATNTDEARRSAMAEAVREARADADVIARAAGGSLGRLIALNSGGVSLPIPRDMYSGQMQSAAILASAPTRIVPGELNVTALVSGRWEFIPGASR
jgi:uncharacterized protein YggE